jgi:tetratricopeptide (TPR) repeat protein
MAGDSANELEQGIADLIAAGKYEDAQAAAEQALQAFPESARLTMLRGIALIQMGRLDEGADFLRQATLLDPRDPEPFYNLAVALWDEGDHTEAAVYARQVLAFDPGHSKAAQLLANCEEAAAKAPFELDYGKTISPTAAAIRVGPDDPTPHVLGLGVAWTRVAYGLLVLCVVQLGLLLFHPPFRDTGFNRDLLSVLATFVWIFTSLACIFWMTVDIVDRREKFVWLLPVWICGIAALPGLPLAAYVFLARKSN